MDEVGSDNPLGREAADEIERLRADIELLKQIAANVSAQGASLEDVEMWLANARAAANK